MNDYKKNLYSKHEEFNFSEEREQQLILRHEIENIVVNLNSADAEDFHILGLAYYDTAEDNNNISVSHDFFIKALDVNEKHYIARLYSAHCYHDKKEYKLALDEYLKVDTDALKKDYSIWRFVKLQEQIGQCLYKLGKTNEARTYFNTTLELFQKTKYEDLADPLEIFECLEETDTIVLELKKFASEYYDS